MNLRGFGSEEAEYYLNLLLELEEGSQEWHDLVSRVRQLRKDGDTLLYTLPGLPLCWRCTVKHLGQALGFAAEVENYPERIICVVGELGHAYRECPDPEVAKAIHDAYQRILDIGCIEDLTPLLKKVSKGWQDHLQDSR